MYRIYLNLAKVTTYYWLITCFIFQSFFLTLVSYPKNSIGEEVNQGNIVNSTPIENTPNPNQVEIPALPISLPINVENNNLTQIVKSRNDVDIVNISTPNNSGFSVNNFTDFNINPQGLVVNNSTGSQDKIISTQIAGFIEDNNNLKDSGSASLILFEVKGNDLSQLNGYLELAGKKADLIIANPNGIVVNGAGFINIGNLNLLVGNTKQNSINNDLQFNLNVNANDGSNSQSLINKLVLPDFFNKLMVIGSGIDLEKVSSAELVANSIKINAPIFGSSTNVINIRSSKDDFNFNDKTFIANQDLNQVNNDSCVSGDLNCQESNSPTGYAIDASNLAKIQAGKIYIVANQDGFGVKWFGEMLAQNDGIKIDAKGNITFNKMVAQKGNILINSTQGSIDQEEKIQTKNNFDSTGNISLFAKEDINLNNLSQLISANNISINSQKNINNNSQNQNISANDFSINAQDFTNKSIIFSNNDLTINVKNFYNLANITSQRNFNLNITNSLENTAEINANNNIDLTTYQFKNSDINSNINYKIFANNLLKLSFTNLPTDIDPVILSGTIISNKDIIISGRNLVNYASINASNDILITDNAKFSNGDLTKNNSEIISGNNLDISASKNIDNLGLLSAKNNLTIKSQAGNINNLGNAQIIGGSGLTSLEAIIGDITQDSSKSLIANALLKISAFNFINNSKRVDAVGKITFEIANDLTNKIKSTIFSSNDIEFNAIGNLNNLDGSLIYAKNNIAIKKYSQTNPLFNANDNKTSLVKNSSSEIIAFEGSLDIEAKKLENIRTIKPAIGLIEGENFIDGTSLLVNHDSYNWIEDSTLCNNNQCATGITKYRSSIPLNANSIISSINANTNLTLKVDEILNQASSIISKGNLAINSKIFDNQSLNYYSKIYQKTVDSNGNIMGNQYFDDLDNNKNYSALFRYKLNLQKNIIEDLSNTTIEKANSNFLTKTIENSVNKNPQTQDRKDFTLELNNALNEIIISKSTNPLNFQQETRPEFVDRNILLNILNPSIIIPPSTSNEANISSIASNLTETQKNQILIKQMEVLVVNQFQRQFEQQAKNLIGDQFLQIRNITEELLAINKNNLLLANNIFDNFSLASSYDNKNITGNISGNSSKIAINNPINLVKDSSINKGLAKNSSKNPTGVKALLANDKIENKNDPQILNNDQNNLAKNQENNPSSETADNKNNNPNNKISDNENFNNQIADDLIPHEDIIINEYNHIENGEVHDNENKNNQNINDDQASNGVSDILVSNEKNPLVSITNDIKKTIMNISGSSIRKVLANSATPVIATGSKISKMIIDKTFGSSKFNVTNNGIKIQSNIKPNSDEELKSKLLKIIPKQNIEQDTSNLINNEINSSESIIN